VHTERQVLIGGVIGWLVGVLYYTLVQLIVRPLLFDRVQRSAFGECLALKDNTSQVDVLQVERELALRAHDSRSKAKHQ
jgi:hypothetical protein